MSENSLINFSKIPGYKNLLSEYESGQSQALISLPRSVRLPFIAAIHNDLKQTILFVTSKSDRLLSMFEEFSFWVEESRRHIFSEPSPLFYERSGWSAATRYDRLDTLTDIAQYFIPGRKEFYSPSVIFASVKSLMTKTMPRRDFIRSSFSLNVGDKTEINDLIFKLLTNGYTPVEIVVAGGQLSRRGGILDIWPTNFKNPARIEFFGDEMDTMRIFDPVTQRSIEKIDSVFIPPGREILRVDTIEKIEDEPEELSEFFIPAVFPSAGSLIDYLPKDSIIVLDNAASLQVTADEIETQAIRTKMESEGSGMIPSDFPAPYITWSEIIDEISQRNSIDLGFPLSENGHQISNAFSPSPRFGSRLDELFRFINDNDKKIERVYIVSKQINRIKEVQDGFSSSSSNLGKVVFIEGGLNAGWKVQYPAGKEQYLFSDSELFGWKLPRPRRQKHMLFTLIMASRGLVVLSTAPLKERTGIFCF